MSLIQPPCESIVLADRPISLQLRFLNSGSSLAKAPSSVVQTVEGRIYKRCFLQGLRRLQTWCVICSMVYCLAQCFKRATSAVTNPQLQTNVISINFQHTEQEKLTMREQNDPSVSDTRTMHQT